MSSSSSISSEHLRSSDMEVDDDDADDLDIMPTARPLHWDSDGDDDTPQYQSKFGRRRGDETLEELVDSLPSTDRIKIRHIAKKKEAQARLHQRTIPPAFVNNHVVPPGYEPLVARRQMIIFDPIAVSRNTRLSMESNLALYKQRGEAARQQRLNSAQ
ncbi:uncharacterized protein LOC129583333 [Paramacrobiotus metropolitanus]|uniref:uncharacterized protein LOC129583333 n=1 Tax=Paramacrobiotus metropolitanus TaxID=2943436 RepID=UPI002445900E|nr:uncharacterized protein LOC129583333 [Paramacrobiotus metropolitanus]